MKKKCIVLTSLCAMLLFTGCGSSNGSYVGSSAINTLGDSNYDSYNDMSFETASYSDYSAKTAANEDSDYISSVVKNNMMIVRNANVSLDVENLEKFNANLEKKVAEFEGYFESSEIENYDSEWATSRYARYTVRIPTDKLDAFLTYTDEEGSITNKEITSEDVSLQYVDTQAHIDALKAEKEHLKKLLDETQNVTEIIEVEDRLSSVQAQLDSYISQKRLLQNRVSYSTIYVNACENRNVEHPIRTAFETNFKERMIDGMENAVDTFVGIISAIPVIIIVTAFILLFIWILRKVWRKIFKKDHRIHYMLMPVVDETEPNSPKKNDKKETIKTVDIQAETDGNDEHQQ